MIAPAPLIGGATSVGSGVAPVNGARLAPAAFTSRVVFWRSTSTVPAAGAPSVCVFVPDARSTPSSIVSVPLKVFCPLSTRMPEPAFVSVAAVVVLFTMFEAMVSVFAVSSGLAFVPVPPVMMKTSCVAADGRRLNAPVIAEAPPALSCSMPPAVFAPVEVIVRSPPSVRFAPEVIRTELAATAAVVTVLVFSKKLLAAAPVAVGKAVAELSAAMFTLIAGVATKSIAPVVGLVMYEPVRMPFSTAVGTAANRMPVPVPGWKFTAAPTVCAVYDASVSVGTPPFAVVFTMPRPWAGVSAPTTSARVAPAAEPWYSKVPPAKPFSVSASLPKMIWLVLLMTSEPLPKLAVGRTRSVPPATVTLPPKFAAAPNVTAVGPATLVPILWLSVTLKPLPLVPVSAGPIASTTAPVGTLVPVTASPTATPVTLCTLRMFVFAPLPKVSVVPLAIGALLAMFALMVMVFVPEVTAVTVAPAGTLVPVTTWPTAIPVTLPTTILACPDAATEEAVVLAPEVVAPPAA